MGLGLGAHPRNSRLLQVRVHFPVLRWSYNHSQGPLIKIQLTLSHSAKSLYPTPIPFPSVIEPFHLRPQSPISHRLFVPYPDFPAMHLHLGILPALPLLYLKLAFPARILALSLFICLITTILIVITRLPLMLTLPLPFQRKEWRLQILLTLLEHLRMIHMPTTSL